MRISDWSSDVCSSDLIEPGKWTPREILGLEVIDRHLVGDRREKAADQPHVMIPRQPRHATVGIDQLHPVGVRGEIVEQRPVGDDHAVRKGGRAARSEEHTSALQSLISLSYAVLCLT